MKQDQELHDVEITMHAFRLLRDGGYRRAAPLFRDMKAAFPEIPEERLKTVMAELCRRLMERE